MQREGKTERHLPLLVHSSNIHNGQKWVGPKLGASFFWVPNVGTGTQGPKPLEEETFFITIQVYLG